MALNMIKKSRVCLITLFLLLTINLVGCGCNGEESDRTNNTNTSESERVKESMKDNQSNNDGGNEHKNDGATAKQISILVSGDEYICDNKTMEIDEITNMIKNVEKCVVEVSDNKATQKAYEKLISELKKYDVIISEN